MNAKWYASILFIILALIGLSQEQNKASNQQVSLQFVDVELSSDVAHDAVLALITQKLQILGADAIEVVANDAQQVSIRYYSAMDADRVEAFLSGNTPLTATNGEELPLELPKENDSEKYRIVVSDLHMQVDGNFTFKATLANTQDKEQHKVVYPNTGNILALQELPHVIIAGTLQDVKGADFIVKKNTSYKIPQVRAGPIT